MNRSRRYGWTLIELLVSITLTSVITGMVVTLLTTLLEYDRRSTQMRNQSVSMARLADQFRADVRTASSINQKAQDANANTSQPITLTLADSTRIVYQQQGNRLLWSLYETEKLSRQESYDLPESTQVKLHESPTSVGEVATLMLDYPLRPEPESKHRHRLITAVLGRDTGWITPHVEIQP